MKNPWLALGATAGIFAGIALAPVIAVPVAGALGVGAVAWASTAIACGVFAGSVAIGGVTGAVIDGLNNTPENKNLAAHDPYVAPTSSSEKQREFSKANEEDKAYSQSDASDDFTTLTTENIRAQLQKKPLRSSLKLTSSNTPNLADNTKQTNDSKQITFEEGTNPDKKVTYLTNIDKPEVGESELTIASRYSTAEAVSKLIKGGADVNERNGNLYYPLALAVEYGNAKTVDILIQAGADVNQKNRFNTTALMFAARNGHADVVTALIDAKADVNVVDKKGNTALMFAARNGHNDVVDILIEKGANVDQKNSLGNSALMLATQYGHNDVVKALIHANADVNVVDREGNTPLLTPQYEQAKIDNSLKKNDANKTPPTTSCFPKTFSCLLPFFQTK